MSDLSKTRLTSFLITLKCGRTLIFQILSFFFLLFMHIFSFQLEHMHELKWFFKGFRLKLYSACLQYNHNLHLYNELLSPLFPHLPFSIVLDVLSYELSPIFSTSTSSRCRPPCSLVAKLAPHAWWPGKDNTSQMLGQMTVTQIRVTF